MIDFDSSPLFAACCGLEVGVELRSLTFTVIISRSCACLHPIIEGLPGASTTWNFVSTDLFP